VTRKCRKEAGEIGVSRAWNAHSSNPRGGSDCWRILGVVDAEDAKIDRASHGIEKRRVIRKGVGHQVDRLGIDVTAASLGVSYRSEVIR